MKTMHVLDGIHVEEISDPALAGKLRDLDDAVSGDTIEVQFGVHTFKLEVVETTEDRVVWKHVSADDNNNKN